MKHFVIIVLSFFLCCSCTGASVKEKQTNKEEAVQYRLDSNSGKLKTSYVKVEKGYTAARFDEKYMQYLHSLAGKYPFEIDNLLEGGDPWEPSPVRMRLMDLMGKVRFAYLLTYCELCSPIEVKGDWVIMTWCQAHACNTVHFVFVVNTKNNDAYALANIQENERDFSDPGERTFYYESEEGIQNLPVFIKEKLRND